MNHLTSILMKTCCLAGFLSLALSCKNEHQYQEVTEVQPIKALQEIYLNDLATCLKYSKKIAETKQTDSLKDFYLKARHSFKALEPVLSFHDIHNYSTLNAPNILKVEEEDHTDIKIKKAQSFQTLEEEIFSTTPDLDKIHSSARFISARLELLLRNTDLTHYKPYHILWLLRKQLVRTTTTGITGFDSPVLENSLQESGIAFAKAKQILLLYKNQFKDKELLKKWQFAFDASIQELENAAFGNFDRYHFLKNHIDPMLQLWQETHKDWRVSFPFELGLSNTATHLFSKESLSLNYFAGHKVMPLSDEKINLGKRLFIETALSSGGMVSCATCHNEKLAFSDGRKTPKGLLRNSPSLTYAAYQRGFFYDRRSGSLEGQILSVVQNEHEFHTDLHRLADGIQADSTYIGAFKKAYQSHITEGSIRRAIADYVRSLNQWDSKFDRNMRGMENTLTAAEINGYNLFNGKAKCATCHFAPVFNGTVPPDYLETEMEHLGIPKFAANDNAEIDPDLGRFNVYGTDNRKHFFKTPSIRNAALTAPYMHNGVYSTLEEVVDFYNKGGGYGIGITSQEYQTLPTDPLNLTEKEQADLVQFMKSLTDQAYESNL